jgi:UDP:flavonoid glycosyltransferase YjiC (YdhE family)
MPAEVERFLDAGDPPIIFTPGSGNLHGRAFFEASVEACERLGRRGLLLTRFAEQVPQSLPKTIRYFDFIPFSQVLPRSAALVHHGGIGTCAQGLAAGVPQLVMPMSFDQPDNAARLRRLGVATALSPRHYRGPAVAQALAELLGSLAVAARCREVARRFHGARPLDETCRLIEELHAVASPARAAAAR